MTRPHGRLIPWLAALFFFSGAAGLGYQVLWAKAFGAGIGHEFPAALAVITAFMSGMALGAYFFQRLPRWLQHYASLEFVIGLWGAATVPAIPVLNRAVIQILGESPSPVFHWAVVFSAVFLGLLPATAAMGATLPAMERLLFSLEQRAFTGLLYAANTAGAMLGAVLTAFWAVALFGIGPASLVFAALNFGCGLAARLSAGGAAPAVRRASGRAPRALTARLFAAGLLGIGFETVMIRALSHTLENTVYTFAVVLAVYLLGSALGAAAHHAFGRRLRLSESLLFGLLALSTLLSGLCLRWTPAFYPWLREAFGDSIASVALAESLTAALVFLAPAFFMGAVFTSLAQASLAVRPSLGWSVAVNSAGSFVAPALFGLALIPAFGLKIAAGLIVLGYAAMAGRAALWLVPAGGLALPFLTASADLITRRDQRITFFRDGVMASVAVLEGASGARVLKVNNRFQMGGTAARIAEARHADIPLLLHPAPRRALFIGLGTGITFATAARYPGLVSDGVELVPEVVEAMPLFQEDPAILRDPSLRVHVADGRRFVLTTAQVYDVIVGDLFHPAQDGAGFLYTREHFSAVLGRLAPDGLFCQWLPLFQMDLATVDIITETFRAVFPHTEMWLLRFNADTPVAGLIGWRRPPEFRAGSVEAKAAAHPPLAEHLRTVALGDTLRLMGCRLGEIGPFTRTPPLNTDQRPVVLFEAPRVTFQRKDDPAARLLELVGRFAGQPPAPFAGLGPYVRARDIYLRGLALEQQGNRTGAVSLYLESARVSPDFTSGYAQAAGIATALAPSNPAAARAILEALIQAQPARPVARQLLERLAPPP